MTEKTTPGTPRGQYKLNRVILAAVEQLKHIELHLPFPWLGLDTDNGGEFINRHVLRWCQKGREAPIFYTRSRSFRSNDNAHVEQKNWTHVCHWFGY